MGRKGNKGKIWVIALTATALFFIVLGIVKIVETNYLMVGTSLITSFVFLWVALKIYNGKINFEQPTDGLTVFFPIGFVFTIIGGIGFLNTGVWGFGLTLLLVGLLFGPKHDETIKKRENAG